MIALPRIVQKQTFVSVYDRGKGEVGCDRTCRYGTRVLCPPFEVATACRVRALLFLQISRSAAAQGGRDCDRARADALLLLAPRPVLVVVARVHLGIPVARVLVPVRGQPRVVLLRLSGVQHAC